MSNNLVTSAWAPGLIGLAISNLMYGVSLTQTVHYVLVFPNDLSWIKSLVFLVFLADFTHLIGTSQYFWFFLVICHQSDTTRCTTDLPWGAYLAVSMNYAITFAVQSFYCHRIWIITGGKRGITTTAFSIAVLQFCLGIWATVESIKDGTIKFLYTTPLVPIAAAVSTLCDILITSTVFKHLWRSELRQTNVFRDLVIVFVNMGVLTCLISITVGVVYLAQGNRYWVGAPAIVLSRCYANSLLAVLNARRRIRERDAMRFRYAIEMPTLSTIY